MAIPEKIIIPIKTMIRKVTNEPRRDAKKNLKNCFIVVVLDVFI